MESARHVWSLHEHERARPPRRRAESGRGDVPVLDSRTTTRRTVKRFRGVLAFKAHRLLHLSTLGSRVIKKRRRRLGARHQPLRHRVSRPVRYYMKRELNINLSGNEVYCTACSLLVILENLCSKPFCQKGFTFHRRCSGT